MKYSKVLTAVLFTVIPLYSQGHDEIPHFDRLTVEDGLSQSVVTCILQDRTGFLWFGTEDGLNQYDGFSFKSFYSNTEDTASIGFNSISALAEDSLHFIWIGTPEGLSLYNPVLDTFYRIPPINLQGGSEPGPRIKCIMEVRNGRMLIGTEQGLCYLAQRTANPCEFVFNAAQEIDKGGLGVVHCLYKDRAGHMWAGGNQALYQIFETGDTGYMLHRFAEVKGSVTAISEDSSGRLWLGTAAGGLFRQTSQGDASVSFECFGPGKGTNLYDGHIRDLLLDHQGALWVATQYDGIYRLSAEGQQAAVPHFQSFDKDAGDGGGLSTSDILDLYEDQSGVLWFGTFGAGLNRLNLQTGKFVPQRNNAPGAVGQDHQRIWSILEDSRGRLWLGTDGGGLYCRDVNSTRFKPFVFPGAEGQEHTPAYISVICEDSAGQYWFGTFGSGLYRYVEGSQEASGFLSHSRLKNATVLSLLEDRHGNLWVGLTDGLMRVSRQTGAAELVLKGTGGLHGRVYALDVDASGNVWAASSGQGLAMIRAETLMDEKPAFELYTEGENRSSSIRSRFIRALYVDSAERVWIGYHDCGVSQYDTENRSFSHYSVSDGLANHSVMGILEDGVGCLWFSTHRGLSRFDTESRTFHSYFSQDGLQSNEFIGGAAFESRAGKLYFGGINGYNAFRPSELHSNPFAPRVALTNFKVYNRSVRPEERLHGIVPLSRSIAYADAVDLPWQANTITLEFAALHYANPSNNQYRYQLSGVDDSFVSIGNRRQVTYAQLRPGRYTFTVMAANSDGLWNGQGRVLAVHVHPAFWMTLWFKLLILALVLTATALMVYRKMLQSRARQQALENRVREKTEAAHRLQIALDEVKALKNRLQAENTYLQDEINLTHNFSEIITYDEKMRRIMGDIEKVSSTDSTVLILGESGTGKELLARAIHSISPRKDRPLMKVDCASLPPNLIESELFGHEKGAFTGAFTRKIGRVEAAHKGTLFLDEIGELPLELQAKLLRFLQDGEIERVGSVQPISIDVRVIAATHRVLSKMVQEGLFREDLYYRLNVFPLQVPPLRERPGDIRLLVRHFVDKYAAKFGKRIDQIPVGVIDRLTAYSWPGNIRELENVIERSVILSQGHKLQIGKWLEENQDISSETGLLTLQEAEKNHICKALEQTSWRVSGRHGAAELLGLKATTLESRMKKLGIERP